jgi:hypothetical protein
MLPREKADALELPTRETPKIRVMILVVLMFTVFILSPTEVFAAV